MSNYGGYGSRGYGPREWTRDLRYGERLDDPEGYSDVLLDAVKSRLSRLKRERLHLRMEGQFERADTLTGPILTYKKARYVYMNLPHRTFVNGHSDFKSFHGVWLCRACTMFVCGVPLFGDELRHANNMLRMGRIRRIAADAMLTELGRPWHEIPKEIDGMFSADEFNKRFRRHA